MYCMADRDVAPRIILPVIVLPSSSPPHDRHFLISMVRGAPAVRVNPTVHQAGPSTVHGAQILHVRGRGGDVDRGTGIRRP